MSDQDKPQEVALEAPPTEESHAEPSVDESNDETHVSGSEDTGESNTIQEEPTVTESPVTPEPSALPHRDTVDLVEYEKYFNKINGLMAVKENLRLVAVTDNLNKSYYRKWVGESNRHFTLLVLLKRRRQTFKTAS